jgi:2-polyprenyl-6-hydroxyphenyl methylase/3-demethylubiquinone-9 3-methyltransferase
MIDAGRNADAGEVARFNTLASRWWDPAGEMRMLHRMNPARVAFIRERAVLAGARVLDVGCGAGLLSEALAQAGAEVTGIDLAEDALAVARLHQCESGLTAIVYERASAEELAASRPGAFDVVTCLEVLEHVPDPSSTVAAVAHLLKPGGHAFFSTINRNPFAYLVTVLGAEYLLGMLPRGTHDYARFIRPSELDGFLRRAGLLLEDLAGLAFEPATGGFALAEDVRVNYLAHCRRPTS